MFRKNTLDEQESPFLVQAIVVGIMLLCFILLGALSIFGKSKTVDENSHYLYGRNILIKGDATRFDDSKMPITALNALPRKIGGKFHPGTVRSFLQEFFAARLVTILFSTLVAIVVFFWSRSLYGVIPALFSLGLFLFDPNIIAHSRLVTTDIYAMGTTVFVFFSLWLFAQRRTILNGLFCGLMLGISLIAKYSAIVFIPLALLTLVVFDLPSIIEEIKNHRPKIIFKYSGRYLGYLTIGITIAALVINVSFLSNRTFTRLADYQFQSDLFRSIQQIPEIGKIRVPLPYPYLEGLDLVVNNERTGVSYGNLYLLGQIQRGNDGFIGYYFIAALLKVPIASQLIYFIAFFLYIRDHHRRRLFFARDIFLFFPVIFFTIYYNFFFNAQIGIRYYLVVFPFIYVFSGHVFYNYKRFGVTWKFLSLVSILYLLCSVLSYYPNFLPYFNELVWNRLHAYRYLADSNIDWGQNTDELNKYLSIHPEAIYAPEEIKPGHIVLSVNQLIGVHADPEEYKWLRNNFEPVDTISYTHLVYKISVEDIVSLCSATDYCDR